MSAFGFFQDFQYYLRKNYLGKVSLRNGSPELGAALKSDGAERTFYRLVLERAFVDGREKWDEVWDVGCRNWSYVRALADYFPEAELVGVEVDGGRRYWNLYRRRDYAEAFARAVGSRARCVFEDFRQVRILESQSARLFCFFFPFVSENPCREWGLPLEFSDFSELLARSMASKSGRLQILSLHQGEWEAEAAREIYIKAGVSIRETLIYPHEYAGLWPSEHTIHLMVSRAV